MNDFLGQISNLVSHFVPAAETSGTRGRETGEAGESEKGLGRDAGMDDASG